MMSKLENNIFQKEVSIDCDGVTVEGEITHQSWYDITVKITKPYRGLKTGVHIPFAAGGGKKFTGLNGVKKAEELLLEVYVLVHEIHKNATVLKQVLAEYELLIQPELQKSEASKRNKKAAKVAYKRGEIDQKEYQSRIKEANKIFSDLEFANKKNRDSLLIAHSNSNFGGMGDEVVEYIRKL